MQIVTITNVKKSLYNDQSIHDDTIVIYGPLKDDYSLHELYENDLDLSDN